MKILNFGSLNYDNVYKTPHFVEPKETLLSESYMRNFGGKGLNQSIALAKAGLEVYHAGKVGGDGQALADYLNDYGVHTEYLEIDPESFTGHAIIEICNAENRILLFGGANQEVDPPLIDKVLTHFDSEDILLIQNELSSLAYLIEKAHEKGMKIYFNTAPMNDKVFSYPLDLIDVFLVNEVEASQLAKCKSRYYDDLIHALKASFPGSEFIMTVGKDGAYYIKDDILIHQEAYPVKAVDTTAAGDTFTGYYIACRENGKSVEEALKTAAKASSMTVQKEGAAHSIPSIEELQ